MTYLWKYTTPNDIDDIYMSSDGEYLTGLWFEGSKDAEKNKCNGVTKDLKIFQDTCKWLDIYFSGKNPDFVPKYRLSNLTPFRKRVSDIMLTIPYGSTITYGDIASIIAKEKNIPKMSSQAVGNAVGWNPICIIIPCHRVIGNSGKLTGYGGGIKNKIALLNIEHNDMSQYK